MFVFLKMIVYCEYTFRIKEFSLLLWLWADVWKLENIWWKNSEAKKFVEQNVKNYHEFD
jgi:hypothetical protein